MTTWLRTLVARRALPWLPAFDALLAAILLALLWPPGAPALHAAICFALALLLRRALGGFGVAPFHPALTAFALAFAAGLVGAANPAPWPWLALPLIALDRLYLPIAPRGKLAQLALIALAAAALFLLDAAPAAYCCALLALQALPPWLDRLTLPRIANDTPPA